jgi:N-acyl homoserine lactone hydrolase
MTVVDCRRLTLEKVKLVTMTPGMVTIPTTVAIFDHPKHGVIPWDTGGREDVADPDGPKGN